MSENAVRVAGEGPDARGWWERTAVLDRRMQRVARVQCTDGVGIIVCEERAMPCAAFAGLFMVVYIA